MKTILLVSLVCTTLGLAWTTHAYSGDQEDHLLAACSKGDLSVVKELVGKAVNVNCTNSKTGVTPLIAASLSGHLDVAKYLLEKGADTDARSTRGVTALMAASLSEKNEALCKLLLEKGAGVAELEEAAAFGDLEQVKELVEAGVNLNGKNRVTGVSPLIAAAVNGQIEVVKYLLGKGADVNAKTHRGFTALMGASANADNAALVKLLIAKGADVNVKSASGRTALEISRVMDDLSPHAPSKLGESKGAGGSPLQNAVTSVLKEAGAK